MSKTQKTPPTPAQLLQARMDKAFELLKETGDRKIPPGAKTRIFAQIGANLNITGQTVTNYFSPPQGLMKRANGYLIEAMIEELNKLPNPKPSPQL